ncbi:tetraacyldisaccharide 4'-kinase [Sphingobacterium endophyticum]|uniref:tetraacyldisaccharide 4'-kinase n=1 Tax=Sphingobacterium endophyticum TaxID=2546448 RepID=UPI0012E0E1E5|nr:tetraacyldisaccharide 4'-kinase [Sphingobacterium endophyticum]
MQLLRWILFPFTILYTLVIWVRNKLYDHRILKSRSFEIPTIVIGNLAVGGAGKSPLAQKLISYFQGRYKVATLSRGYGRKTKGFRYVQIADQASQVGDEPLQFKKNFPDVSISVDENRIKGIEILEKDHDLIILDDAYQHRKVKPRCSILLFEYQSLLQPIYLLPTGNFRDTFDQTRRADLVLITKCPADIPIENQKIIEDKIRKHNQKASVYYSKIGYKPIKPLNKGSEDKELSQIPKHILLLTGIANPRPLVEYLINAEIKSEHLKFPDHHQFDEFDYKVIRSRFEKMQSQHNDVIVLTTEKDAQRLSLDEIADIPFYYIPIDIHINQEEDFFRDLEKALQF